MKQQYLEVPLEGGVGKVVHLKHVLLVSIIVALLLYQHHGVNERVHSRQLLV